MARSLAGLKMEGAKLAAQEKIEKEFAKQQKRSKKRGFFSKVLGGGLGKLLGAGLTGALGLTGIGAPIAMALSSMAGKQIAHGATKGMGADLSKLKTGKYGLGAASVAKGQEALRAGERALDPSKTRGGFGAELLGATMTAGLAGDLKGAGKSLLKGGEGSLKGAFFDPTATGGLSKGLGGMWGGAKEEMGSLISGFGDPQNNPITEDPTDYQNFLQTGTVPEWEQGGQVPNEQQQLLQLLALAQMQQPKTTYDDTALEEKQSQPSNNASLGGQQQPTISEYFGSRNKTLGGSNTKSLSQLLGR